MRQVGLILGSREARPLEFWVAVPEGSYLRLDDLVCVEFPHPEPSLGNVRYYGMVDEVFKLYEGKTFDTDVFLAERQLLPVSLAYIAHVQVTRILPEEYLPPSPGAPVYLADEEETLGLALYYERMGERKLPVGLLKNGQVAYVNFEFVNGFKGGHINISGISGVAAKTSYATFLLHSLFHSRANPHPSTTKALIFNVKGEDLFYLDKPNRGLREEDRQAYQRLGLPAQPFTHVAFLAPPRRSPGDILPDVTRLDARPYYWDLVQFCREGLLPFLFADRGTMSNLGFLIDQVTERLRWLVKDQEGPDLWVDDWGEDDLGKTVDFAGLGRRRIASFAELVRYIEYKLLGPEASEDEEKPKGDPRWTARQARGTLEAFVRRLRASAANVEHLIRGDRPGQPPRPLQTPAQLSVIDIHQLHAQAQMFVVGALLQDVFGRKERDEYKGRVFVVLDELNKYAPREGESPIKDILLDIAERGRSLGVILIGAQQTASEVEGRIVGNAAIRVVGRLDAAEAERPEYRYLPASFRQRAVILPQGTVILHQPEVPVPLALTFPLPAWAMKQEEVEEDLSASALSQLID
ncbi:ATP-binding protein [Meiothermus sp. QL-1]|uniref:ATP-binding protein n=1 Tax=Meiothermus sp. QL-1 TaxID=2058095 RepID=UPI000E0BFD3B|nr:ATP-binding protein [Meiothermus sp. QL-1]RDI94877.1 ATP-binding protein [Meiothermus sp. QL-1]